ncbi:MAG: NAD(P)-dependent oxidoreductase [Flavobacteriales bacterium]|nr:NAD(P)-dependent oxidoreductase [Flavobacteriales bacterium]
MKILFIDTVHPFLKKELEKQNHICEEAYDKTREEVLAIIENYEGIVLRSRIKMDEDFLSKCHNLKFIARAGSGLENIDEEYAKSKNIKCFNAAEGNRQAVAEHTLGMLLSLFNNLNRSDKEVRSGIWEREVNTGVELAGKTIGIIGYGNNGSAFAEVLSGFGVRILAYDKYLEKYKYQSSMQEIFQKADVLSLHIPLTAETTYLVDENFIHQFEKPIYIINTARGKCVHSKDLVTAMKNGKVLGACLDVLEYEKSSFEDLERNELMPELQYIFDSAKTILSPHIAGWTHQSSQKIAEVLVQKINSIN